MIGPDDAARLAGRIGTRFPDREVGAVEVTGEISRGWESVIDGFTLHDDLGAHRYVLRRYEGAAGPDKCTLEYSALRELRGHGYPVPAPVLAEPDASIIGAPFLVMEHIDGRTLWDVLDEYFDPKLLDRFTALLTALHDIDPAPDRRPAAAGGALLLSEIEAWRRFTASYPREGFDPVFAWLEDAGERVAQASASVVHWDFHPDNVLLGSDGRMTVIDWTQYARSDARLDLAWTILLLDSARRPAWATSVLQGYEAGRGRQADLDVFLVAAAAKRLYAMVVSVSEGPEALGMRADAAADIAAHSGPMRRVYDILHDRCNITIPEVEEILSGA